MSSGIATAVGDADSALSELLTEKLHRVRYQMWKGHWHAALDRMGEIYRATKRFLNSLGSADAERVRRFRQHMVDLRDYLCSNWLGIRNYAAERRKGLKMSSALAESAMSHLVNQRMGKRQPGCAAPPRAPTSCCRFAAPSSTTGWTDCSANGFRTSGPDRLHTTGGMTAPSFNTVPDS